MSIQRIVRFFLFSMALTMVAGTATAQQGRVFGVGQPAQISDLPSGPFRAALQALSPQSRGRALSLLQGGVVPAADLAFMRVDKLGAIFYVDPTFEAEEATGETVPQAALSEAQAFQLHSKPGAQTILYLDFDGHNLIDTAWNGWSEQQVLYMRPYSIDGDDTVFSTSEIDRIAESWRRVAEDFAPFDVDVTTEEPPYTLNATTGRIEYGSNVGHILMTPQQDANGFWVYTDGGCGCGGVAYYNGFGNSYYSPGLVFNTSLSGVSEAISHEFGHNLYLSHDGQSPGDGSYYRGHGSGAVSWAPIMGVGYSDNMTQWSKGEYLNANNLQDDLAQIATKLPYRADDHEDLALNLATALQVTGGTDVVAQGRVSDPSAANQANRGIIEDRNDIDLFSLSVGTGTIDLTITPAHLETYLSGTRSNLDIRARLLDSSGVELQSSNPDLDIHAAINYVVTAPGTYYLEITGVGRGDPLVDGYTDYGSIGEYFITGTVPSDIVITNPPSAPDDLSAVLLGSNSIELVWNDPISQPETNEDGYRVLRSVNGGAYSLRATLPGDSEYYADNNLANGGYAYMLEVYNSAGSNQTAATTPISIAGPTVAVATSESTLSGSIQSGSYMDTQDAAGSETLTEQHSGGKPSGRTSFLEHIWTITGVVPGATVELEVTASAAANSEDESFDFSYSINGGDWASLGTILPGTGSTPMTAPLYGGTSGTVRVKVVDGDPDTIGAGATDTVTVHQIAVRTTGDGGDLPPVVSIDTPADGITVGPGDTVAFTSTIVDEDTDLDGKLSWSSSLDGNLGVGSGLSLTTLSVGSHTITASVTDSAEQPGSDQVSVIVSDEPIAASMHIASLTGTGVSAGKGGKWRATVNVLVENNLLASVSGAVVSGVWSNGASGTGSCITGGSGFCEISKSGLKNNAASATFTVTGISGALIYNAGVNAGTSITVPKP